MNDLIVLRLCLICTNFIAVTILTDETNCVMSVVIFELKFIFTRVEWHFLAGRVCIH